jgi:hypothetical protein
MALRVAVDWKRLWKSPVPIKMSRFPRNTWVYDDFPISRLEVRGTRRGLASDGILAGYLLYSDQGEKNDKEEAICDLAG